MHSDTPYTRHPYGLTLTLLIIAEKQQRKYADGTFEDAVYEVIDHAADLAGWSDERRADLYARIAESVTAADTLIVMENKINACLWKNEQCTR